MNWKRYVITSLAVYVALQILDFIIHGGILSGIYEQTASLWREDMEKFMWLMYLVNFVFSFILVYIFTKGYEGRGIMEGVRFGFWVGLLLTIPQAFGSYAIWPIPFQLAIWWFVLGTIQLIIVGIVAAAVYRPAEAS